MKIKLMLTLLLCLMAMMSTNVAQAEDLSDADEMIVHSQIFKSADEKADYLVSKGRELLVLNSAAQAKQLAEYVLGELDAESEDALDLLSQSEDRLQKDELLSATQEEPKVEEDIKS